MTWNLGSVAATVLDLIDDIPANISGTRMLEMADRKRTWMEERTGLAVGSVEIAIKFQDALVHLTAMDVANTMSALGADSNSIQIGDLKSQKGQGSNMDVLASKYRSLAMQDMKELGRRIRFQKTFS